jgi:hypothetical protein
MHVDNLHLAYFVVHRLHSSRTFALEVERTVESMTQAHWCLLDDMTMKMISLLVLQEYFLVCFVCDEKMRKGGWDNALCSSFQCWWTCTCIHPPHSIYPVPPDRSPEICHTMHCACLSVYYKT